MGHRRACYEFVTVIDIEDDVVPVLFDRALQLAAQRAVEVGRIDADRQTSCTARRRVFLTSCIDGDRRGLRCTTRP
jgi:hypothetical protein